MLLEGNIFELCLPIASEAMQHASKKIPPNVRCAAMIQITQTGSYPRFDLYFLVISSTASLASLLLSLPDLKIVDMSINLGMAEDAGDHALVLQGLLPLRDVRVKNRLTTRLGFSDRGELVGAPSKDEQQKKLQNSLKNLEN